MRCECVRVLVDVFGRNAAASYRRLRYHQHSKLIAHIHHVARARYLMHANHVVIQPLIVSYGLRPSATLNLVMTAGWRQESRHACKCICADRTFGLAIPAEVNGHSVNRVVRPALINGAKTETG